MTLTLNEKLRGGKHTTLESFLKQPVMGKKPNDLQPGPTGLQPPVMVEDNEMAVANPLTFLPLHFLTNPKPATHPPSIQASPTALHFKV
jgi:hypothetical protein